MIVRRGQNLVQLSNGTKLMRKRVHSSRASQLILSEIIVAGSTEVESVEDDWMLKKMLWTMPGRQSRFRLEDGELVLHCTIDQLMSSMEMSSETRASDCDPPYLRSSFALHLSIVPAG